MATSYAELPNKLVSAPSGIGYAYRDTGGRENETPLVLLNHFRGNLDNWDPTLVDALVEARRVIAFDKTGVGDSTGVTPDTIGQMVRDAITFVAALGLGQVDLLGFSIGSFVAQEIALIPPRLPGAWCSPLRHARAPPGCTAGRPLSSKRSGSYRSAESNTSRCSSPRHRRAGKRATRTCGASMRGPRTGTRSPPGPPAKRSTTRSAPGGAPTSTRCWSTSPAGCGTTRHQSGCLAQGARERGAARIVSLSSTAHMRAPVDFDDIHFERRAYDQQIAYAQSKTANSLFAVEATRRWGAESVVANAVNPGGIKTGLQRNFTQRQRESLDAAEAAGVFTYKTIGQGAATTLVAAVAPEFERTGGHYLDDCREAYTVPNDAVLSAHSHGAKEWALDPGAAHELWSVSLNTLNL